MFKTSNIRDLHESQSLFFKPDLKNCLFIQAKSELFDFLVLFQTVLGKSSVCLNVQTIFETFYLQSQFSIFLLANFPDFFMFYLVLENL